MKSGLLGCLVLAIMALAIPALGPGPAQARDPAVTQVRLQLKWRHQFQFAGYYAAIEKGYYREAGLEVTLAEAAANLDPVTAVLRGGADYAIATSDLVLGRAQGEPVMVLAPIFQHSPFVLFVPARSGIRHVHDLDGRRVMLEDHAEELVAYFRSEGLALDRLKLLPHRFDPKALIDGEVDAISAYSTDEAFLLNAVGLDYMELTPRSGGIDFYGDTLFTSADRVAKDPAQVAAFVQASLKGWAYALDHSDEIVDLIIIKYSRRHSREHLRFEAEETKRLIRREIVELGYSNPGRWRHIADTYADLGMMPRDFPVEDMLWRPDRKVDLTRFYAVSVVSLLIALVIGAVSVRFYQLNRRMAAEIAERVAAERDLRRMSEAAEAASRAKSEFLAGMSHEIRTPLNGMLGMASLLLDGELSPSQRHRAQVIQSSGEALLDVVNDVLDLSKIEAGAMELDTQVFEPRRLFGAVQDLMSAAAAGRGLALRFDVASDLPVIAQGDEGRLRQVLCNLVGNAIKFTDRGEVVVTARATAITASDFSLHVRVSDTGVGVPDNVRARLFEAFFQASTNGARRPVGTGLGLAICRQLVELMGGTIGLESRIGIGSTFWFRVPLAIAGAAGTAGAGAAGAGGDGSGADGANGGGTLASDGAAARALRILVAEDDPVNQMVVAGLLRHGGHHVQVVSDGVGAVKAVSGQSYDLILMDLQMPELDGVSAARAIRAMADPLRARVPIIALTANALAAERERCLAAGMNDYVTKPIRREALMMRIAAVVAARDPA